MILDHHPRRQPTVRRLLGGCLLAAATLWAAGCTTGGPHQKTAAVPVVCTDVTLPIYFAKGSDTLSDPARQAIAGVGGEVKGCRVREVDVFGLADMDGPADRNLALSQRRASVVAQALAASGFPEPLFDVKGLGKSNARTAQGRPAMLQRKTLVVIHVAQPG